MPYKRPPVDVLWCGNARAGRSNGWSFPPRVERHLREATRGKRVCHLFGGRSRFGLRLDVEFRPSLDKPRPRLEFTRGPALRYNRWLNGEQGLPFAGGVEPPGATLEPRR